MIDIFEAMAKLKKNTSRTVLHAYDYDADFYLLEAVKDSKTIDYGGSYYAVNKNDGSIYHYSCNADFDKFFDAINNRKIDISNTSELKHHGILGMKWDIRRYQNKDGSLTEAGKKRYYSAFESAGHLKNEHKMDRLLDDMVKLKKPEEILRAVRERQRQDLLDIRDSYLAREGGVGEIDISELLNDKIFNELVDESTERFNQYEKLANRIIDKYGDLPAVESNFFKSDREIIKKDAEDSKRRLESHSRDPKQQVSAKRRLAETSGKFDLDFLEIVDMSLDKNSMLKEYDKYLKDPEKWSQTYDYKS